MLRSHPLSQNTFYDTAVQERLNYQAPTLTAGADLLSLEDSERNYWKAYTEEENSVDKLAKYKLFLNSSNDQQFNKFQQPNPASTNLYRSWPVWSYSHRDHEDVYHTADSVEDLIEEEFMSLESAPEHYMEYRNRLNLDFMAGLRRKNWEGKHPKSLTYSIGCRAKRG